MNIKSNISKRLDAIKKAVGVSKEEIIYTPCKIDPCDFVGHFKKEVVKFIKQSKVLDRELKRKLEDELDPNWHDDRFKFHYLIQSFAFSSLHNWESNIKKDLILWDEVVKESSSHSSNPEEIANRVLIERRKQFNLDHNDYE